jgi:hypothetical protein
VVKKSKILTEPNVVEGVRDEKMAVVWCASVGLIAVNIFFYHFKPSDEHLSAVLGAVFTLMCAFLTCLGLASGATHFRPFDIVK